LLFDGGLGTRLIALGLPAGKAPESWVIENPDAVKRVHQEYVSAGADVLATCTFGANRIRLMKNGLEGRIAEINRSAVLLTRQTVEGRAYVAGDMGPSGEFFEPHGALTDEAARRAYEQQATLLSETGVDLFLLETFYDLREAAIAVQACRRCAPDIPVAVTMTFNRTPKGFFTVMGDPAVSSLQTLAKSGAMLVGANCTLEAEGMLELAKAVFDEIETPLLFQANAGSPEITSEGVFYRQGADEFLKFAAGMLKLGARAVGGCCGTDADHIRVLRRYIDEELQ
jgi:methionine synthase I (cobalamin-dependent)